MKYILKILDSAIIAMQWLSAIVGVLLIFVPGISWAAIAVIGLGGPLLFTALQAIFIIATAGLRAMIGRDYVFTAAQSGIFTAQEARYALALIYNHPVCFSFFGLDGTGDRHGHKYADLLSTEVK